MACWKRSRFRDIFEFYYLLRKARYLANMTALAPIVHHLNLYAYWQGKRGSRTMPARKDINPAEIPILLPYLVIVEKAGDQFRNRLVGSALVTALGEDPTGKFVGHALPDPASAAEARAIFERAYVTCRPVFATGEFILKPSSTKAMSLLVLPLSDDGERVNMSLSSLVARFNFWRPSRGWLKDVPARVCSVVEVGNAGELENLCLDWERRCSAEPAC